jgi:hypothetical protein
MATYADNYYADIQQRYANFNRQQRADDDDNHFYGAWHGQPRKPNGQFGSGSSDSKTKPSGTGKPTKAESKAALEKHINIAKNVEKDVQQFDVGKFLGGESKLSAPIGTGPAVHESIDTMAERGLHPDIVKAIGPVSVRRMSAAEEAASDKAGTLGDYDTKSKEIRLTSDAGQDSDLFLHEYGHHVTLQLDKIKRSGGDDEAYLEKEHSAYYEFKEATGSDKGNRDWENMTARAAKSVPSAYATSNFDEWRAESFMQYMKGGSTGARLQRIAPYTYEYIESCVTNKW